MFISRPAPKMVDAEQALPGRATPVLPNPEPHAILGTELLADIPNAEVLYLAAGCYWGVEEIYWQMPGVLATAVGFMGGFTPNPTYEEVCTGLTGHAETVRVVFDPARVSAAQILKTFFECHDPTSLNQQGGDIGTQYRSALFFTRESQEQTIKQLLNAYEAVLAEHGKGNIVTQVHDAADYQFYLAHDAHQQYLHKNPDGYRCHSKSGIACPLPGAGPLHL